MADLTPSDFKKAGARALLECFRGVELWGSRATPERGGRGGLCPAADADWDYVVFEDDEEARKKLIESMDLLGFVQCNAHEEYWVRVAFDQGGDVDLTLMWPWKREILRQGYEIRKTTNCSKEAMLAWVIKRTGEAWCEMKKQE